MNILARGAFLSYVYEYNVDTTGFIGPALELLPNDALLYTWKKIESDSTAAILKVFVRHKRFSETSVHTAGSEEYWKKLRSDIPRPEYKR